MAEEIKKVITIEVGKSITSIRDFRKHIEDLRGSLLVLNQDSEEYKTIAEQIAQDQAKLNEVLKVGKGNTDAAAGSYVELNNQLKALRNQYKALSEADREGAVGQNMLVNIQQLDEKLKDLDEGMGVYNRNVGNYKQAFEEAFKAMAHNIGNVNPQLGKLMQTAAQLIPLIKAASKAASDGLKGVKAGIASTGIGLLVVALGEILANWEAISGWIQRVIGKQKELTDETKNTANAAGNVADKLKSVIEYQNALAAARGVDPLQIASNTLTEFNNQVNHLAESEDKIKQFYSAIEAARRKNVSDLSRSSRWLYSPDINGVVIEAAEDVKKLYNTILDAEKGLYYNVQDTYRLIELRNGLTTKSADVLEKNLKAFLDFLDKELDENNKAYETARNNQDEANKEYTKQLVAYQTGLKNRFKSELELRKDKYEREKQLAIDNISNEAKRNAALLNLQKEYERDVAKIREDSWKSSSGYAQLQEDLQNIKAIKKRLEEEGKTELDLLTENHMKELELFEKYGLDSTALREEYARKVQEIVDKQLQDELEANRQAQEKLLAQQKEYQEKRLENQQRSENWDITAVETRDTRTDRKWYNLFGLYDGQQDIQKEREKEDSIYQIQQQGYMDRIDLHQQYLQTLEDGTEEYMNTERAISEEKMNLAYLEYEYQEILNDRILEDAEKKRAALNTIIESSISAYKSITDAIIDSKEIEQGSEKWKAIKISQAVITTTHGVLSAFMSGFNSGLPAPWNIALGTATAAAAAAAGAAEIAKIKSTQMGSTSSASSGISTSSSMGASVSPLLNPDYDLQRITNLSLQSDDYLPGKTQVYVLESDIQEVGNRVQVRENNATF